MALIDDIKALPSKLLVQQDTQTIADALPPRIITQYTEIGKGKIIGAVGLEVANNVLDVIDSNPVYRHVKQLVENGWLDIGSPLTRYSIDTMVPTIITQGQADTIKALGETSTPVNEYDVRCICWSDKGEWLV
jgi:hypothetical protein